jgi:hypothetical protein
MAKIKQVIGSAVLEVEGDEAACSEAARMFHLMLAEQSLRDVEDRLAALKPLQKQRRDLTRHIATLKTAQGETTATVQ